MAGPELALANAPLMDNLLEGTAGTQRLQIPKTKRNLEMVGEWYHPWGVQTTSGSVCLSSSKSMGAKNSAKCDQYKSNNNKINELQLDGLKMKLKSS